MSNQVAVVSPTQSFVPIAQSIKGIVKNYKNGGMAVKHMDKKTFKEHYLAKPENHGASNREVGRQFNEYCKVEGEKARIAAVAFFSNPDVLVNGSRQNKDGSKGAVNFHRKSALKLPTDRRKATLTPDQVVDSISNKKFTRKDLELMQAEINTLLAE